MIRHLHPILTIIVSLITLTSCNRIKNYNKEEAKEVSLRNDTTLKFENEFKSLDKVLILKRLFDNPTIDTTETALWEPNYNDRMILPISYDNKCHTAVDTIMYFDDNRGEKCAVVIFTHYYFVREHLDSSKVGIGGSHFTGVPLGVALFKQSKDNTWEIYKFNKHFSDLGYFGTYRTGKQDEGKISLKEIGDRWTCLSLKQGIGGSSGALWGYESLYSIEQFQFNNQQSEDEVEEWYDDHLLQNLLTYNYYYSYGSADGKEQTEKKSKLRVVKKPKNYYDIDIVITKNSKIYTEKYYYSERQMKYIQMQGTYR